MEREGEIEKLLERALAPYRLAHAAALAKLGNYREAEHFLTHHGGLPQRPEELDLLARIAARQWRWRRAKELWKTALWLEPKNPKFLSGIQAVEKIEWILSIISPRQNLTRLQTLAQKVARGLTKMLKERQNKAEEPKSQDD